MLYPSSYLHEELFGFIKPKFADNRITAIYISNIDLGAPSKQTAVYYKVISKVSVNVKKFKYNHAKPVLFSVFALLNFLYTGIMDLDYKFLNLLSFDQREAFKNHSLTETMIRGIGRQINQRLIDISQHPELNQESSDNYQTESLPKKRITHSRDQKTWKKKNASCC